MQGVKYIALGIINRWCGNKLLEKVHGAVSAEENVFYRLTGRGRGGNKGSIRSDA